MDQLKQIAIQLKDEKVELKSKVKSLEAALNKTLEQQQEGQKK